MSDITSQCTFDYSRNETSNFGKYANTGQHAGVINNNQTTNYHSSGPRPLGMLACDSYINEYEYFIQLTEELRKRCSPSASFNSEARFDPPRCTESTRVQIIQLMEDWMNSDGAGKSALAQSVSEKFETKELAASFFFFRGDSTRNNGDSLIPTLVSQLANILREFKLTALNNRNTN